MDGWIKGWTEGKMYKWRHRGSERGSQGGGRQGGGRQGGGRDYPESILKIPDILVFPRISHSPQLLHFLEFQ